MPDRYQNVAVIELGLKFNPARYTVTTYLYFYGIYSNNSNFSMKNNTKRATVILLSLMTSITMKGFSQQSGIIAEGAKPQLVSNQFSFTEGPAVDKKGNVFFTDQPNNKIWKYDTDGKLSVFMDKAGRSNGT